MKKFFKQLAQDFSDKEYAHNYMESHAVSRLAAQIHALRKQRGWSQEELSKKSGLAQEQISKIESAGFNSLTMKTLQKLSRAFDVHLHIAFEPFSKGIIDIGNLRTEQLEVASRVTNLETAFSDMNQCEPQNTLCTEMAGPNVFLMFLNTGNNSSFQITSATFPHALSCERSQHFQPMKVLQNAATNGSRSWLK